MRKKKYILSKLIFVKYKIKTDSTLKTEIEFHYFIPWEMFLYL